MRRVLTALLKDRRSLAVGSVAAFAVLAPLTYMARAYQLDDALIYYRYLANLLNGNGLVYNAGEKLNALTSPLYTYVSIIAAYILGDIQWSQIILGSFFLFLTAVVVMLIFETQGMTLYGVLAALTLVSTRYYYLTLGLETTMLLFLVSLVLYCHLTDNDVLGGIASACLLITRGESLFLILIILAFHVLKKRRIPAPGYFLAFIVILTPHYLFNFFYYGQLLPHSLAAKTAQGASGLWGEGIVFFHFGYLFGWAFGHNAYLLAMILGLSAASIPLWLKTEFPAILVSYLMAHTAFYVLLDLPNYHWYYAIYFFVLDLFAPLGIKTLASLQAGGSRPWGMAWRGVAPSAAVVLIGLQLCTASAVRTFGPHQAYKNIGIWLREQTPPHSKIAAIEIGHIGWYSKRYIVDILGLVSFHNAELLAKRNFSGWLDLYDPDYILTRHPLRPKEKSVERVRNRREYQPVTEFPFEGYLLLKKVDCSSARSPC